MRPIDADALKEKIEQCGGEGTIARYCKRVLAECLDNDAPTIDAVPVVHARWINHKDEHQCSACKEFTVVDAYVWIQLRYDFCPYCGAKMDGDENAAD